MPIFDSAHLTRARRMSDLVYCNPFLGERIEFERAILGAGFDESTADWNVHPDWRLPLPNIDGLIAKSAELGAAARQEMVAGIRPTPEEADLYEDVVMLGLYYQLRPDLDRAVAALDRGGAAELAPAWDRFVDRARHWYAPLSPRPDEQGLARIFAFFFQFCSAFHRVFDCIIGTSQPAVRLRAQVWQSIFTRDMRRYRHVLFERMGDHATLITGPSGTGKELVARAIGQSRFLPFDPKAKRFAAGVDGFFALNLSALGPQLIEAELFGHRRGAFTGAVSDREGWLEACPPHGCVFLDEIGETDPAIQVKLLRVLEKRRFSRVGESKERAFAGKLVAATNRDLAREMRHGRFREDLYYRLCADTIRTPSLHERIVDDERERHVLLAFLARRLVGEAGPAAQSLVAEVERWIDSALGRDYRWPGNVRELEQCMRNVMIRGEYHPAAVRRHGGGNDAGDKGDPAAARGDDPWLALADEMRGGGLSAEQVLRRYCRQVHRECGSLSRAAQRLHLDRRTVKAKVDEE
ncbi:MAG: sigma-54-dependent Fis family transcriptional regulator [Planctomycetes bacterium]|nr:sigma-54-dependent Fis family transcriptional regulator [Planctomycetota bacterium]